ncbi:MAG: LytR/AlgR family response regulator transcription factor [Oscillospiraceae bacterium]
MFKIAVCDDEKQVRDELSVMLNQYSRASEIVVTFAESSDDLCDMLMDGKTFDMIILDILSGVIDGIRLGKILREKLKNTSTHILYISNEQGYAMDLFDIRPLNFIVKPIPAQKLYHCIDTAMDMFTDNDGCLVFNIGHTEHMIPYRNIRYIESNNKQVTVHAENDEYTYYGRLDDVPVSSDFIRVHKSYYVNRCFVRAYRFDCLKLDNDEIIPISRSYQKEVRELLHSLAGE